jgi:SAM-dependent methyltransferase
MTAADPPQPYGLLFVATIACGAFLLFLVQPLIAKQILPWFGGSAAVWSVCLVFFQTVLLAGYAYADLLTRRAAPRTQTRVHIVLLVASLAFLPVVAGAHWKPLGDESPAPLILGLLAATIGLPYFLLSSTGPLLQAWAARGGAGPRVYRLFSLSNLASLLALLAYPVAIEPHWPLATQARAWSVAYVLFVVLCGLAAWRAARLPAPVQDTGREDSALPPWGTQALWFALPACATALLLAVTNHLTQNVASIPFLWVLPLVLYLLSFVFTFEHPRWYHRALWLPLAAGLAGLGAWGLNESFGTALRTAIPLYASLLFVACLVLHGEVVSSKPGTAHLTRFYLLLAAGGAAGGAAVGLLAPLLLAAYYELGITLVVSALLLAVALRGWPLVAGSAAALSLLCAAFLWHEVIEDRDGARTLSRNFYGTLRTYDHQPGEPQQHRRVLLNGAVKHGEQFVAAERRREPTSYYGPQSGVGLAIALAADGPRHIGLIGLGAGTLAVYGRAGDRLRFYDINPQVIDVSRREFSFIADSPAEVDIVTGDARLALEREPVQGFDVLAVDAFSGGAIPVHLLTAQALQAYRRHMKPGGVIAVHVSNRFLDLPPVVVLTAQSLGLHAALVSDAAEGIAHLNRTDWVLVARDPAALASAAIRSATRQVTPRPGARPWTDDDNDLFSVVK